MNKEVIVALVAVSCGTAPPSTHLVFRIDVITSNMAIKSVVVATQFLESIVPLLQDRLPGVTFTFVRFENAVTGHLDLHLKVTEGDLRRLQDAEYLIIDSCVIGQLVYKLPKLRWMQACAAGLDSVTNVVTPEVVASHGLPTFVLTRFSGDSFAGQMFEYCFCYIVNYERGFLKQIQLKSSGSWSTLKSHCPSAYRMVHELTIAVLGIGAIGRRVAKMFKQQGCRVSGFGRRHRSEDEIRELELDSYSTSVCEVLRTCDYFINVMPFTEATVGLLNGVFEICEKRPIFINLGRGSVVNTEYLIQSLDKGLLSHAVLDVFETEPLPPSSPLWTHEKVSITPHVSCETRAQEVATLFVENLHLLEFGKPLNNVYNWCEKY